MQQAGHEHGGQESAYLKLVWLVLLVALPVALTLLFTPLLADKWTRQWGVNYAAGQVAPYRLPLPSPGNLDGQIAFYQDRIRRDPKGGLDLAALAGMYLKRARVSSEASWYLLAEQAAARSLANLPVFNNGATLVLAQVAESRHDFAQAVHLAEQVRKVEPGNEDALSVLVTSNLALGRVDLAARLAEALVSRIANTRTLTLRAQVKLAQGKERGAIQDLRLALAAEQPGEVESSARTRTLLGRLHAKRGRYTVASDLFREALRILPPYPLAQTYLAELAFATGQWEEAERLYAQAFSVSPQAAYLIGMARVKERQGDNRQARELRTRAETMLRRDLSSGAFGHRRELARLLLQSGRPPDVTEALALARAEVRLRSDAETLDTLAWALVKEGRWREAGRAMRLALRWGLHDADMFFREGTIERALGHRSRALVLFRAALLTNPSFEAAADALQILEQEMG